MQVAETIVFLGFVLLLLVNRNGTPCLDACMCSATAASYDFHVYPTGTPNLVFWYTQISHTKTIGYIEQGGNHVLSDLLIINVDEHMH
jgi:(2Fe-2S) ferredoxin